jgi:hypothetical protein
VSGHVRQFDDGAFDGTRLDAVWADVASTKWVVSLAASVGSTSNTAEVVLPVNAESMALGSRWAEEPPRDG